MHGQIESIILDLYMYDVRVVYACSVGHIKFRSAHAHTHTHTHKPSNINVQRNSALVAVARWEQGIGVVARSADKLHVLSGERVRGGGIMTSQAPRTKHTCSGLYGSCLNMYIIAEDKVTVQFDAWEVLKSSVKDGIG